MELRLKLRDFLTQAYVGVNYRRYYYSRSYNSLDAYVYTVTKNLKKLQKDSNAILHLFIAVSTLNVSVIIIMVFKRNQAE